MTLPHLEDLLRPLAPQVLGALVRRYGHFATAEDAVQEALLAATQQWPAQGVPDNPRGWLITVASRRLTDLLRAEQSRRDRETRALVLPTPPSSATSAVSAVDDTLILLLMCCHPSLSPSSQIALTLRAVGGLSTGEVARAFLVPEATMTRRITRAKQSIKDSGQPFALPSVDERPARLAALLHVLYLIFNEGYVSTAGPSLYRADLSGEAIRLARLVHRLLPDAPEAAGLLALMLLTDARRPARTSTDGALIPMAEQDRTLWDGAAITEGVTLITHTLPRGPVGPYQLQAAIAALHDEAPTWEQTDWPQICALYEVLLGLTDNPVVALNHTVALAMAHGPAAGLERLAVLESDQRLADDHRVPAVRAHLQEMSGDPSAAAASYREAAARTLSLPQQRYLNTRATHLAPPAP